MKIRIDKVISDNLNISRKDAKKLLLNGSVMVNGAVIKASDEKVDIENDTISVNGKVINCSEHIYIMMNKPSGVVSASEDKRDRTVVDFVPDDLKRKGLFPAGRLDKDTVGFVLITDDGEFAHNILSPRHHVEKVYIAGIAENLSQEDIQKFSDGIELGDGTVCLSADVKMIGEKTAQVKITEGRYHQVKRMFASLGNKVLTLKRTSIGSVELDENLKPGECRLLTKNEVEKMLQNGYKM